MNLFFTILTAVGFVGALLAVILYAIPEKARMPWFRTEMGRFIMADSFVFLMLYASGLIRVILPTWQLGGIARVVLTVAAVVVVWWRVSFMIRANYIRKKEKQDG